MFTSLRRAYNDGKQVGRMGLVFVPQPNGTKLAQAPEDVCPYRGIRRLIWVDGWCNGNSEVIQAWLARQQPPSFH